MAKKLTPSFKFNEDQIERLKQIVPEAFKDGMLDFNALYDALQNYTDEEIDADDNFYGLYWPGKKEAKRAVAVPPRGTLIPVKGDGIDEETTKNLYIEGDNLEVLKILQKAYAGKISVIFIDPPYNIGSDELYEDNFSESIESYRLRTGQYDSDGIQLTTNTKADGRYHSKWLSIMYPRIKLANSLLQPGGVIFISIDDNEVHNLRLLCNEIFGDESFVAQIPWRKRTAKSDVPFGISQDYDCILCYGKTELFSAGIEGGTRRYFETEDLPGKPWRIHDLTTQRTATERPNSNFTMVNPKTSDKYPVNPNRTWAVTTETFEKYYKDNRIVFPGDYNFLNITKPAFRYFKEEDIRKADGTFGYIPVSTFLPESVGMSETGTKEITELFNEKIFSYPKPSKLIQYLIKIATVSEKEAIILDFFSGSASTAQAVIQHNYENECNFNFIVIQIPEKCKDNSTAFKSGYKNICEIGKERIRRAGKKIKQDAGLNANNLDIGFKVFRLSPSNYKKWANYTGTDIKEAEALFEGFENPLVDGWKPENLLTEIMLIEGFPLDSVITNLGAFKKNKIEKVSSDFCDHSLFVCLDRQINAETIKNLALEDNDIFICLDSAIGDQDKARLDDKGLIKTI
ncbi:hypothetical protein FACS189447_06880 [Spirochaetia bacterium]|nr:hypothetical protein FACS189447_06880 [Spirochaetia bacterium]